jgi:hypothetical protein
MSFIGHRKLVDATRILKPAPDEKLSKRLGQIDERSLSAVD